VLITRRTLLLGAAATALAACSTRRDLSSSPNVDAAGQPQDDGVIALPRPPAEKVPKSVVMVGDSITDGSKPALELVLKHIGFEEIEINAERSRRIEVGGKKPMPGLAVVSYIAGAAPPDMWVIALGTNDAGLYEHDSDYEKLINDILDVIPKDKPLVWINTYRDDHIDGCEQFNGVLQRLLQDRGHATVGQWFQQCAQPDRKILSKDGVHPNDDGVLVFADTVGRAILQQIG
jgi:lysophospholipase L1-like esterase